MDYKSTLTAQYKEKVAISLSSDNAGKFCFDIGLDLNKNTRLYFRGSIRSLYVERNGRLIYSVGTAI
jgi:hypothetical protein